MKEKALVLLLMLVSSCIYAYVWWLPKPTAQEKNVIMGKLQDKINCATKGLR